MIEVHELTKRYGPVTAVDAVSFTVRSGTVTGFLGPNGAGKSTTMRMICGLASQTSGTVTVLGQEYRSLSNPGRTVGVLLDAAAQHQGRTGREILTLAAMTMGLDTRRVSESLDMVGLTAVEGDRRLKGYSLGMRQRLGIAQALLGDPQILILDEPANGLDPAGIRWMRDLLRDFADRGGCVLLSSHLLNEVQRVVDELIVIGHGRIVARGTQAELLAGSEQTVVRSLDDEALGAALQRADFTVTVGDGRALLTTASTQDAGTIALREGIVLTELRPVGGSGLEDLFLRLTQEHARQEVAA